MVKPVVNPVAIPVTHPVENPSVNLLAHQVQIKWKTWWHIRRKTRWRTSRLESGRERMGVMVVVAIVWTGKGGVSATR